MYKWKFLTLQILDNSGYCVPPKRALTERGGLFLHPCHLPHSWPGFFQPEEQKSAYPPQSISRCFMRSLAPPFWKSHGISEQFLWWASSLLSPSPPRPKAPTQLLINQWVVKGPVPVKQWRGKLCLKDTALLLLWCVDTEGGSLGLLRVDKNGGLQQPYFVIFPLMIWLYGDWLKLTLCNFGGEGRLTKSYESRSFLSLC